MISVFFSYSHRDEAYRNELELHLAVLKREGLIDAWHDRRITAGKEFDREISHYLETADIILLLVSPYFLASDYCYEIEMQRALQRHDEGTSRVIPIVLEPCDWQNSPFGKLRATPHDGRPLAKFPNIHDGYLEVVHDIRRVANELLARAGGEKQGSERTHLPIDRSPASADREPRIRPRSSNLRVKAELTDKDRDDFLSESFDFIAIYFENSLLELSQRNPGLEGRFRRLDSRHISAAIYRQGVKKCSCRVWLADHISKGVAFAYGDSGADNSFNEVLQVDDDGFQPLLKPMGMAMLGTTPRGLTQEGAAEYLWSLLIAPLQR